ncbi:hypothetical protein GCM10027296_12050 [Chitinimonas naiadis]
MAHPLYIATSDSAGSAFEAMHLAKYPFYGFPIRCSDLPCRQAGIQRADAFSRLFME